jgi:hypothetical protein
MGTDIRALFSAAAAKKAASAKPVDKTALGEKNHGAAARDIDRAGADQVEQQKQQVRSSRLRHP